MDSKPFISLAIAVSLASCSTPARVFRNLGENDSVSLELAEEPADALEPPVLEDEMVPLHEDVTDDGCVIMHAVKDEDGEMVATDVIDAAMVVARFRNVAERNGKVYVDFKVLVPQKMLDSRCQIRIEPTMEMLGEKVGLDRIFITGKQYREAQLRGYQRYQRFLDSIIEGQDGLVDSYQLDVFIKRNIPSLYAFKNDSTYVSEEVFYSFYGVSEKEAVWHYTNKIRNWNNERKKASKEKKYSRFVKSPIVLNGIRLDTLVFGGSGALEYEYSQEVQAVAGLKKLDVTLEGEIYEQDRKLYSIPRTSPLTYYISSLSSLADTSTRYLTRTVERTLTADTACYIEFAQGSHKIDRTVGNNDAEIGRIEQNIVSLVSNDEFVVDSVVVTSSSSPEGQYKMNEALSLRRSQSVASLFRDYMQAVNDSIYGVRWHAFGGTADLPSPDVRFVSRSNPENWRMLDAVVKSDETIPSADKMAYERLSAMADLDEREAQLSRLPSYDYFRRVLYPRLRTVRFDFHMHRKGMVKDTLMTTSVDTVYMAGVRALRDLEYEKAVSLLRPYKDYNSAVAFCSLGYDASALEILLGLDKTPRVNYLLALVYSRKGMAADALRCFEEACAQDPSLIHRGNLDPEISGLLRKR